jgi:hypothetical protein
MRRADRARAAAPGGEDRRGEQERRSGFDRRGSNTRPAPRPQERAYGFRDFRERRGRQDRRLYGQDGDCRLNRAEGESGTAGCFVYLTSDEIAALLSEVDGVRLGRCAR